MKNTINRTPMLYLSLFLVFASAFLLSCISVTSAHSVEVQNNSDEPIVILSRAFIDGEWGDMRNWGGVVDPGAKRAIFSMVAPASKSEDKRYQVEARDLNGKLIKNWEFPYQERILLVIDNSDVP